MKYLVLGLCCVFLSLQIGVLAHDDVSSTISKSQFNQILKQQVYNDCPDTRFYTYEAFITAARSFKGFGTTGDINTRKREIAAFVAQTTPIIRGGAGGYCKVVEGGNHLPTYCTSPQWPCVPDKRYYGRGPIQIVGNGKYGQIGKAIGVNLLANPDLVETDPVVAFKTAIWFWMTPQSPRPSSNAVMTNQWEPSPDDIAANRVSGFGVVTNIFNGYSDCGKGLDNGGMQNRIEFFKTNTKILGVSPGNNLDCAKQRPFP